MATAVEKEFPKAVAEAFGFLLDRGFTGPEVKDGAAWYRGPGWDVLISLDLREHFLDVAVIGDRSQPWSSATVDELYVDAGFGPAQDIKHKVTNLRSLQKVLASQATAFERLSPLLTNDDHRPTLLRRGRG